MSKKISSMQQLGELLGVKASSKVKPNEQCSESLVYSTEKGDRRKKVKLPVEPNLEGAVLIHCERKGRAGKNVTVVTGLPLTGKALVDLGKCLKSECGSGGTIKAQNLELQGDHRHKVQEFLQRKGYCSHLAGERN